MWHKGELFDISRDVWQSFSSKQLLKSEGVLEIEDLLSMQWFYCHLSSNFVVMLAIDLRVGYQLASDMLNTPVEGISGEDEQDAMIELMNCICGRLDRDHPANDCFELPRLLQPMEITLLLNKLHRLSDVTASIGEQWFYISLFEAEAAAKMDGSV